MLSHCSMKVSAPDGLSLSNEVTELGGGQYGVVFEPAAPGRYVIGIKHVGQHIKDSPFHINIGGQPGEDP